MIQNSREKKDMSGSNEVNRVMMMVKVEA